MCRGNRKRDVSTMVTYSHASTPLGQSKRAYYLSYFIISNDTAFNNGTYTMMAKLMKALELLYTMINF